MMSGDGLRRLVLIGLLCLGGWGLIHVFSRWQSRVPTRSHAATEVLGHPYLADRETNIFHHRRYHLTCSGGDHRGSSKKNSSERFVGFNSRAEAIEAGYYPCEECDP